MAGKLMHVIQVAVFDVAVAIRRSPADLRSMGRRQTEAAKFR
jgi:hypothetical protein